MGEDYGVISYTLVEVLPGAQITKGGETYTVTEESCVIIGNTFYATGAMHDQIKEWLSTPSGVNGVTFTPISVHPIEAPLTAPPGQSADPR